MFQRNWSFVGVAHKILIVDDDPFIQTVVSGLLTEFGYEAVCASSGTEGLEMLSKERFSCVLLDLYMDDISGLDVLAQARETWDAQTLPILMISAEEDESSVGVALDFGANDYLIKPVDAESLRTKLAGHLPSSSSGSYEIKSVLRQSGDVIVQLAFDPRNQREVELKVTPRAEFEGQILKQISHPNVVVLHDVCLEDTPFLVTESLEGKPMSTLAGSRLVDSLVWIRELLHGLAAVHQQGYAHGAIEPANLMLTPSRQLKLTEFGSARKIESPADVRADLDACLEVLKFWRGEVAPEVEEAFQKAPSAHDLRATLRVHLNRAFVP